MSCLGHVNLGCYYLFAGTLNCSHNILATGLFYHACSGVSMHFCCVEVKREKVFYNVLEQMTGKHILNTF